MSYFAKIRTGNGPIEVPISKPTIAGGDKFKLKRGSSVTAEIFEKLPVEQEAFETFFCKYARRRDLTVAYDCVSEAYVSFNPRYETFRFANVSEGKYDLLNIVDPEFITITRK